jgi:hypothetical protein
MELHSQQSRQTSETGSPLLSWPCPHDHNLQPPPHHYHYRRPHTIRHAHQTTTNGFMTITPIGSLPSSNRTAPKPAPSFKTIRKWQTNSPPTLQRQDLATPHPTSDGPSASRRYPYHNPHCAQAHNTRFTLSHRAPPQKPTFGPSQQTYASTWQMSSRQQKKSSSQTRKPSTNSR